jgi:hypothetical protein
MIDPKQRWNYVGQKLNRLEEVESGLEHDLDEIYTEYVDLDRDPWRRLVLPVLRQIPAGILAHAVGISVQSVRKIRNEQSGARRQHLDEISRVAGDFAQSRLRDLGSPSPSDHLAAFATYLAVQNESRRAWACEVTSDGQSA